MKPDIYKRIGILTFHYSKHNFGAVLQTFASYTILQNLGYFPKIINLLPEKNKISILSFKIWIINSLASTSFDKFREKYLPNQTRKVYSFSDCAKLNNQFSIFYVGSDQVWRPDFSESRLFRYYLDFVENHKLKIAYAPSFGLTEWTAPANTTQKIKLLLQKFSSISVREDSGVNICKNVFQTEAKLVLDPTLLLTEEGYSAIENKSKLKASIPQNYIGYYLLADREGQSQIPLLIKKQTNFATINLYGTTVSYPKLSIFKFRKVEDWLSGIKNATLVVTDSYHCVIFSIIYKKNFVCLPNEKGGISRVKSLLQMLHLENRYCDQPEIDFLQYLEPINYNVVYGLLDHKKSESYGFLTTALSQKMR